MTEHTCNGTVVDSLYNMPASRPLSRSMSGLYPKSHFTQTVTSLIVDTETSAGKFEWTPRPAQPQRATWRADLVLLNALVKSYW
ncbi:hypothetical protein GCM10009645_37020 [Mycolicibacterium poriferae]|uniref:Uncharacterized protein n=1 Tax=Mycolicibacterium poriferae TaxID=39694 RepID=A0A6N4V5Z6_9MYCO|nr:hypothetical protein MPOR_13510 [Mycolicibacterium poriferae]